MIISAFQHAFHPEIVKNGKTVTFSQGDLMEGKVIKLFPNQMALLSINGLSLMAKLEAPLTAQTNYWFQVESKNDTIPYLKVLPGISAENASSDGDDKQIQANLLKELDVPITKRSQHVLSYFLDKKFVLSQQKLITASNMIAAEKLTTLEKRTIEQMIQLQLPFTETTFKSMLAIQNDTPLSDDLAALKQHLPPSRLSSFISHLLSNEPSNPKREALINIVNQWLVKHSTESFAKLQALNIVPKDIDEQETLALVTRYLSLPESRVNEAKEELMNRLMTDSKQGAKTINQLMHLSKFLHSQSCSPVEAESVWKAIHENLNNTSNEQPLTGTAIKNILCSLGLQHEADICAQLKSQGEIKYSETLKALLLEEGQRVADPLLKEKVETLINKLTGFQLLSQENGPMTNVYMQLPIVIGDKWTDLTFQWSGRKKHDGTIDPNYCHILFYVTLNTLDETLIDVTVQNRIVHVHVINDYAKQLIGFSQKLKASLQQNLEKLAYHLSDVKISAREEKGDHRSPASYMMPQNRQYEGGVDFLI
ncbi:hypothetical protein FZC66_03675 [Priestia megaterium]|nr:hypothetical protein FZC66_03675 [Priestia megaterium]